MRPLANEGGVSTKGFWLIKVESEGCKLGWVKKRSARAKCRLGIKGSGQTNWLLGRISTDNLRRVYQRSCLDSPRLDLTGQ